MFHMHAVVALGKMDRHFTGVVKTARGLVPKAILQKSVSPAHARRRIHLISTVGGVRLVATSYKYSRRKIPFFISTVGVGDMADGSPFIQC
jgi:hypothetical protein